MVYIRVYIRTTRPVSYYCQCSKVPIDCPQLIHFLVVLTANCPPSQPSHYLCCRGVKWHHSLTMEKKSS